MVTLGKTTKKKDIRAALYCCTTVNLVRAEERCYSLTGHNIYILHSLHYTHAHTKVLECETDESVT